MVVLLIIGLYLSMLAVPLILLACGFLLRELALGKVLGLVVASVAPILLVPVAGLLGLIMDSPAYNGWLLFSISFSVLYLPVIVPISILLKAKKQKKTNLLIAGVLGIVGILCSASGVILLLIARVIDI